MRALTSCSLLLLCVVGCGSNPPSGAGGSSSSSTGSATVGGTGTTSSGASGGTTSGASSSSGGSSGSSGGANDLSGSLAYPVGSAWLFTRHFPDGGPNGTRLEAKLFGPQFTCVDATTNPVSDFEDAHVLVETSDGTQVATGTYAVGDAGNLRADVSLHLHSSASTVETVLEATQGTIIVTSAQTSEFAGSFSATLALTDGGSGTLSGNFDAAYCH